MCEFHFFFIYLRQNITFAPIITTSKVIFLCRDSYRYSNQGVKGNIRTYSDNPLLVIKDALSLSHRTLLATLNTSEILIRLL